MTTDGAIPLSLMRWTTESWVSRFISPNAIFEIDPNQAVSELGSRMLHLAAMSPHRPSKSVTTEVMQYLLAERRADPNVPDIYGRTPLTFFITQAGNQWSMDEDYGCQVLSLLFDFGANANVLFTPDFVSIAGCEKWTLSHHLTCDRTAPSLWPMPVRMRDLLESRLDWTVPDSAGRTAERRQFQLAL